MVLMHMYVNISIISRDLFGYKVNVLYAHFLLLQGIPASLGVSATKQYHVNSLAVPRKAKEAIGGITRLTHADGITVVISLIVEYRFYDNSFVRY